MSKTAKKSTKKKVLAKPAKRTQRARPVKPQPKAGPPLAEAKPAKPAQPAKLTQPAQLIWKRSKRGRPKKKVAAIKIIIPVVEETNGNEGLIEQSKFVLGPKENAGEFQAHNLPFDYGHNRIIFLVVDPTFVFVYWEVREEKMREAVRRIGSNAKLTLRFYDLTDTGSVDPIHANRFWDVSIYERVSNWYLRLNKPGQQLVVDIGMKNERGDFYIIARSNTMRLPSGSLAAPGPIKWMVVGPSGEKVITEVEDYTDADLELLRRIMGPYFFDLLRRGRFTDIAGSSAANVFIEMSEIMLPEVTSH